MTSSGPVRPDLSPADGAFVDRVREVYTWPEQTDFERAAFRARLDERLPRTRGRRAIWVPAALATAGMGVAALVISVLPLSAPLDERSSELLHAGGETAQEALLALTQPTQSIDRNSSLPTDYEAISSLLLDGV